MTRPLYKDVAQECRPTHNHWHKGLWFERFVDIYAVNGQNWSIPKPDSNQGGRSKNDWIETVTGPTGNSAELKRHALTRLELVEWLKGEAQTFNSDWHFATGLGNPHPVENGFLWHPTLGVPYLPGASVKGLVRAWVEHWDDSLTPDAKTARCRDWFGSEDKDTVPEKTGQLIVFDALPVKPVTLVQDVMTPHYGDWYEKGGKIKTAGDLEQAPADWHDPVPVPFLVVKNACWLFAIAPRDPAHATAAAEAMEVLKQALEWLGAGAKTAVGYGRMTPDSTTLKELQTERDRINNQKQQAEREKNLSELERQMEAILHLPANNGKKPYIALIESIKQGKWSDENRPRVAAHIKTLMQADKGQWKETSGAKDPKKDKEHQRTLEVMAWLGCLGDFEGRSKPHSC